MSKFNHYAQEANRIAKEAFKEYKEAEQAYREAQAKYYKYPQRVGFVDHEYAVKSLRAKADFEEAKNNFSQAKRNLASHQREFDELRSQLSEELDTYYAVNPEAVDSKAIELMKSGVLTLNDYKRLMNEAEEAENFTMMRMVSKYAKEAGEAISQRYGEGDLTAREFQRLSYVPDYASKQMEAFDLLKEVYDRSVNNSGMIDHWEELTSNTVENF